LVPSRGSGTILRKEGLDFSNVKVYTQPLPSHWEDYWNASNLGNYSWATTVKPGGAWLGGTVCPFSAQVVFCCGLLYLPYFIDVGLFKAAFDTRTPYVTGQ